MVVGKLMSETIWEKYIYDMWKVSLVYLFFDVIHFLLVITSQIIPRTKVIQFFTYNP